MPLMEVVEAGIDRHAFSADCLNALIRELHLSAQEDRCKVAVIVDGVNPLFNGNTYVCKDWDRYLRRMKSYKIRQRLCTVDELSVMKVLIEAVSGGLGGKNVLMVTSVGKEEEIHMDGNYIDVCNWWRRQEIDMRPMDFNFKPFELLGDFGWRCMHPFIPIEVKPFSEAELDAMIDYGVERGLLSQKAATDMGRLEIRTLTAGNGDDFRRFSVLW